jgi:hypothetical protein
MCKRLLYIAAEITIHASCDISRAAALEFQWLITSIDQSPGGLFFAKSDHVHDIVWYLASHIAPEDLADDFDSKIAYLE